MSRTRTAMAVGTALVLALTAAACRPSYQVEETEVPLTLACGAGTTVNTNWFYPVDQTPAGLIWLQHGFSRSNDAVADLSRRYAARGYVVVAPTLGSFGACSINEGSMHTAVANALLGSGPGSPLQASSDAARAKLGRSALALPSRFVVSGHSAGGALVTVVAGKIAASPSAAARSRLAGVVLLDPVENSSGGMAASLPWLNAVKVLTISAAPGSCNSSGSGTSALQAGRSGWVGVRMPSGCHCDAEADSTDALCTLVCGTPKQANKDALRRLAANWADDMLRGTTDRTDYPGGEWFEQQRTAGTIVTLEGSK